MADGITKFDVKEICGRRTRAPNNRRPFEGMTNSILAWQNKEMTERVSRTIGRYAIAVITVGVGLLLKHTLNRLAPQADTPFLLMALTVIVAGWYGGIGPALLATAMTMLSVRWFFMDPPHSLTLTEPGQGLSLFVYVIEGALVGLLCESRLIAVRQSEEARGRLEQRVTERTAALEKSKASLEQEVAERRRFEAELSTEREYLKALLATLAEGIVSVDETGRVVLINRAAMEMYGLPNENVPYEDWERYHRTFYGDGVTPMPQDERPLSRVLRDDQLVDAEKVVVTNGGRRRDLLSTGRGIVGPNGERLGAVVAFRDVTERKRHEEELERYMAQLSRSNRELQDFASVASHDLQEPLRKIQAFGDRLQLKQAAALGDEGKDYLARMLNAAARMSTLISDLLTFSRVTTRAQPFKPVDLAEVAREVASDLEAAVEKTGGRIEIGTLPTIEADAMQIRQLLQNLIGNALKFHKPGEGVLVQVKGTLDKASTDTSVCQLTIRDNGIGFEEKYLDRIFNVFQRLHGRNEYEGTGIGLAVCRKIAERHHGSITARSVPGEGSTFIVTLPTRQPDNAFSEASFNGSTATE